MKITKNIPLLVGITLPVVFIFIISIVIFTPSLFIKPQYNFLYSNDNSYYSYNQGYSNTYAVKDNHLSLNPLPTTTGVTYKGDNPPLFLYNVKDNSIHQVDFNTAKDFVLDPGPSSPDGYTVEYKYSNEGIFGLFGGSSNNQNGYVISKGNGSKKLNGLGSNGYNYYQGNFKFIGWVK